MRKMTWFVAALAIMLAIALAIAGCGKPPISERYAEGMKFFEAKDYQGAMVVFRSILEEEPPAWVESDRFGVFTVESRSEVQTYLDRLGISVFQEKNAAISDNTLDELIGKLLTQRAAG